MKSMTGFGRGEAVAGGLRCTVELSSVNRKQSDIDVRLPRAWAVLEAEVRRVLTGAVSRGRVQVQVAVESTTGGSASLTVNDPLAMEYLTALTRLAAESGVPGPTADTLLRAPGVFTLTDSADLAQEQVQPVLEPALAAAVEAWSASREREGAHLRRDLESRLATLRDIAASVAEAAPQVALVYRDTLTKRLAEAGLPLALDDERLLKEIALYADRADISEEVSRFGGHLDEFHRLMDSEAPAGRPLDFLCQELHRELNTMGAKANHAGISHLVVAGKTEVERVREQVQNVE